MLNKTEGLKAMEYQSRIWTLIYWRKSLLMQYLLPHTTFHILEFSPSHLLPVFTFPIPQQLKANIYITKS